MKTEAKIQQECVMWFKNTYCLNFHNPKCVIFSVPNEAVLSVGNTIVKKLHELKIPLSIISIIEKTIKQCLFSMIGTGLFHGTSDFVVLLPKKILFIECKDDKGKQSDYQQSFENDVTKLGFEYHLVCSIEQFKDIIKKATD